MQHILLLRLSGGKTHTKDSSAAINSLTVFVDAEALLRHGVPPLSLMMLLLSSSTPTKLVFGMACSSWPGFVCCRRLQLA